MISTRGGVKHLVYEPGVNVQIVNNRGNAIKKLFVNGKKYDVTLDLIVVPELKDENVYIEFNGPRHQGSLLFGSCAALKQIPGDLFADYPSMNNFSMTFSACKSLQSIPASLFDNQRNITNVLSIFTGCTSLTGESPYTMVGDKKVHLYERYNYPEYFVERPDSYISHMQAFTDCTGLTDYAQIPSNWK